MVVAMTEVATNLPEARAANRAEHPALPRHDPRIRGPFDEPSDLGGEASAWAHNGFAVFPCRPRGKEPLTGQGFYGATSDETELRRRWRRDPTANIGLRTGGTNRIIVVDIDGEKGERLLAKLEERYGKLPPTATSKTGIGKHLIFELPEDCGPVSSSAGDGLDIRADGGYVIAPPSIHQNGKCYEWDPELPEEFALAPEWLLDFARNWKAVLKVPDGPAAAEGASAGKDKTLVTEGGPRPFKDFAPPRAPEPWSEAGEVRLRSALAKIPAENRDIWLKVGFALYDLAAADPRWPGRETWDEWSMTYPKIFDSAGQDKAWELFGRDFDGERVTVATIYHLAKENGWIDPLGPLAAVRNEAALPAPKSGIDFSRYERTDAGNALAFLDLFGENLRFIEKWGCWIVWDGARWREASDITLLPLARRTTEEMMKWAVNCNSDREAWMKHALATQRDARLRAMINLAKGEPRIRIEPDALDGDLWLLGCPNGTLDLRTGKRREARREDYITKKIGAEFDPKADCREWRGIPRLGNAGRRRVGRIPSNAGRLCPDGRSPRGGHVRPCWRRRERQKHLPHDLIRLVRRLRSQGPERPPGARAGQGRSAVARRGGSSG